MPHPPPIASHAHRWLRLRRWLFKPWRFWTIFFALLVLIYFAIYQWWFLPGLRSRSPGYNPSDQITNLILRFFSPAVLLDSRIREWRTSRYIVGSWQTIPVLPIRYSGNENDQAERTFHFTWEDKDRHGKRRLRCTIEPPPLGADAQWAATVTLNEEKQFGPFTHQIWEKTLLISDPSGSRSHFPWGGGAQIPSPATDRLGIEYFAWLNAVPFPKESYPHSLSFTGPVPEDKDLLSVSYLINRDDPVNPVPDTIFWAGQLLERAPSPPE